MSDQKLQIGTTIFSVDFDNELEISVDIWGERHERWIKPADGQALLDLLTRWLHPSIPSATLEATPESDQ